MAVCGSPRWPKSLPVLGFHEDRIGAEAKSRGTWIAAILEGAWREPPPHLDFPRDGLAAVTPYLLKSASAPLAWRRIRNTALRSSGEALELQQAYRLHALQAAMHDRNLERLVSCLTSSGIRPLLGKGWAVARLYPEPGLRPYGDFDFYVNPDQRSSADAALLSSEARGILVDLHSGFGELDDRTEGELHARSELVQLGRAQVPVFGPEDHIRLLCLHMLRHGAWRPLWLCDVALALERYADKLDWDYLLSGDPRRSEWVVCTMLLARQLLDAQVETSHLEHRPGLPPRWLIQTLLAQWGAPTTPHGVRTPMADYLQHPIAFARALLDRWPNAIEATVSSGGRFSRAPRLPYQLGECALRTARFLFQKPKAPKSRK